MIKDGGSGAFNLLGVTFRRILVLFVVFVFLTVHSIGAQKFAHTPRELFLCMIVLYFDSNPMLEEAVLENFRYVQA